jgi:hypothetical protein
MLQYSKSKDLESSDPQRRNSEPQTDMLKCPSSVQLKRKHKDQC